MHNLNKSIKKILIANRSEIASRIIASCKSYNIKTVAIFCKQDQNLSYIYQADEAYKLTLNGAYAYLNEDEIIKIAKKSKATAIHPGYGFLSENALFAQKVIKSGLIWIGPNPQIIKKMGNKIEARKIMKKNNIPIIPGSYISNKEKQKAKKLANQIGFPVILKDPNGGGGKAIKLARNKNEFELTWDLIISEAKNLTGSNQILIEKYIEKGRHIEIQVVGDGSNYIHLYERECSIQRKNQKIIEESPCNFIDNKILNQIYKTALNVAKTVKYNNIGTVEFIVTSDKKFYFLEMNTRLQVEHSVTEIITGLDLIALQIEIAQTKKLNLKQCDINKKNHAIECRIYAEDSENNFLPSTGIIKNLQITQTPFLRFDHNLEENQKITSFFDSMILKLTSFGQNRNIAINNIIYALEKLKIDGIKTNIKFLKKILTSKEFIEGKINTQLLLNPSFYKKITKQKKENNKKFNNSLRQEEVAILISAIITNLNSSNNTLYNSPNKQELNKIIRELAWRNKQWQ